MPIASFKTRAVRDLAWACFSPPLLLAERLEQPGYPLSDAGLALTPQRQSWLQMLDREPGPLQQFLAPRADGRLGLYFERLWHFFLGQDPAVELVAHNLPVREQGRTIGEFDCLYFCHQRQRHVHLELAVKFFLSYRRQTTVEAASQWCEWLGPNRQDRLDLKIEHLLQRQTRLGDHPAAQHCLRQLGIETLTREVDIKGYLFTATGDLLPPPQGFNPRRQLQHWVPIGKLSAWLAQQPQQLFTILPRKLWLGQFNRGDATTETMAGALLLCQLQQHFSTASRPRLVACMDADGTEQQRLFVTGDAWPADRATS